MRYLLLLVAFLTLTPATGWAQADYPWDETVNLNNEPNACSAIMRAFEKYNRGTTRTPRIRIQGSTTITESDLHRHQYKNITTGAIVDAPWKYCFGEIPAGTFEGIYPIADGTNNTNSLVGGHIYFDNVDLTFRCGGQTIPVVIYQQGDVWINGRESGAEPVYGGGLSQPPPLSGNLTIRMDSECDGDFAQGRVVSRNGATLFDQQTTTVGIWVNGAQRRDGGQLTYHFIGNASDNDDIGFFQDGLSTSNNWGYIGVARTGIGMLLAGPVGSSFNEGYIEQNSVGVAFGDPSQAGDSIAADTCVAGTDPSPGDCGVRGNAVSHVRLNGLVIEGNTNEVLMYEGGTGITFAGTHIETDATEGHGIVIGAGTCSGGTRDGLPGATAADCTGGGSLGTAQCAGSARSFSEIRFIGGYIPGDKGAVGTPDWGGTVIGRCANDSSSKIVIGGTLVASTISGPTSVAFQWASELSMPNAPQVDVTNLIRTTSFYWPNYPNLFHNGALSVPFQVNAASWTTGQYISFGGDITAGVASSSIFAAVPLPWAHLVNYQVHHLDIGAFAAHTGNQTCNFVPVKMDYDHGTLSDVTGTTAAFTGNPIDAGDRFVFNYTPDASTVLSFSGAFLDGPGYDKVGIRVENGSNCDELFASGAITLLPLE